MADIVGTITEIEDYLTPEDISLKILDSTVQSAVTNGHWCGGKRPQCGASAVGLS